MRHATILHLVRSALRRSIPVPVFFQASVLALSVGAGAAFAGRAGAGSLTAFTPS